MWLPTKFPDSFDGRAELAALYLPKLNANDCGYVYPLQTPYRVDVSMVARAVLCKSVNGFMHISDWPIAEDVTHVIYRRSSPNDDMLVRGWIRNDLFEEVAQQPTTKRLTTKRLTTKRMKRNTYWQPGEILVNVHKDSPQKHKDICKYLYAMGRAIVCATDHWSDVYRMPYNPNNSYIMRMRNWADALNVGSIDYMQYAREQKIE